MKQKNRIRKNYRAPKPVEETQRNAHCTFCGGRGIGMDVELVESKIGSRYRVPKSHEACKATILSLSLSLSLNEAFAVL
jgi:hypothetical protein